MPDARTLTLSIVHMMQVLKVNFVKFVNYFNAINISNFAQRTSKHFHKYVLIFRLPGLNCLMFIQSRDFVTNYLREDSTEN
jgi:hypothetical protein